MRAVCAELVVILKVESRSGPGDQDCEHWRVGPVSNGSWNLCDQVPVLWSEKYRPTIDTFVAGTQFVQLQTFLNEFDKNDKRVCVPHPSSPRVLTESPLQGSHSVPSLRVLTESPP